MIVNRTVEMLKEQGIKVSKKDVWFVYGWWTDFIRRVIEDGTGERISIPYFGNFSPRKSYVLHEIREAMPAYMRESIKTRRIKSSELLAIFNNPELSSEYIKKVTKMPRFIRASDFTFSPNNKPVNGRTIGIRPEFLDHQAEQGVAPDHTGDQGADPAG